MPPHPVAELNVEPATETTELYSAIRSQAVHAAAPVRLSPYKGLCAFKEADAADFFGRDGDRIRLLDAVRSRATVMLVGASACGKSSLVHAGLLPQLRQEGGWAVATFRPGAAPFRSLATALAPLLALTETSGGDAMPLDGLCADLATGHLRLGQAADRVFERSPRMRRLLVVVDQLEELLDPASETGEGREFLGWLSAAVAAASAGGRNPRPPLVLLMVLREDCLAELAAWPALTAAWRAATLPLVAMTQADLEQAVARPAERLGVTLEPGLLQRLVGDASGQPGGLALLELTLTELWQCQQSGVLTHAAYGAIGCLVGVAARHAGSVFGKLDPADQTRARLLLMQMVRPGVDAPDVRRSASPSEIVADVLPVLGRLAEDRLVVTSRGPDGQATVDLPHDELVRHWGQLKTWVDADREFCSWLEDMRAALRLWQAVGARDDLLLHGAVLEQARTWLRSRGDDVSATVRQFVASSELAQARQRADDESRRRMDAERSRALAAAEAASAQVRAAEQRRLRRLGFVAAVMAAWSLVATGAFVLHWLTSR